MTLPTVNHRIRIVGKHPWAGCTARDVPQGQESFVFAGEWEAVNGPSAGGAA